MGLFNIFKKKKIQLTQEELKWNKMWELWSQEKVESPYAQLMTYQSDVNNGGHPQYFFNIQNTGDLEKELGNLEQLLPAKFITNIKKAYKAYLVLEENEDDQKSEEILDQCDDVFYENEEEINGILEEYALKIEL